jgi:hypothetical protein
MKPVVKLAKKGSHQTGGSIASKWGGLPLVK